MGRETGKLVCPPSLLSLLMTSSRSQCSETSGGLRSRPTSSSFGRRELAARLEVASRRTGSAGTTWHKGERSTLTSSLALMSLALCRWLLPVPLGGLQRARHTSSTSRRRNGLAQAAAYSRVGRVRTRPHVRRTRRGRGVACVLYASGDLDTDSIDVVPGVGERFPSLSCILSLTV